MRKLTSGTGDLIQQTYVFEKIEPEEVETPTLQTRPYQWVTFKNVSLKPNFKTDVQIERGYETVDKIESQLTPSLLWHDDFETGNFDTWESTEGDPEIVDFDSHSGSYSIELEGGYEQLHKQGAFRSDSIVKLFHTTAQSVTVNAWIKVTQWSEAWADIHFSFLKNPQNLFEGLGRSWMWSQTEGYYFDQTQNEKRFTHNLPMNQWNHLKLCYDISNGGTVRYYENDVLQLTIVNAGTDINGFFIGAGGCCGPVKFLVDDISYSIETPAGEKFADSQKRYEHVSFKKDMPIREALRALGGMYKKNIIPSDGVDGQVPVSELYDVTFEEVLKAIIGTHKYIIDGNFIRVYTAEEYKAITLAVNPTVQVEEKSWGEMVSGLRTRLRPLKSAWTLEQTPALMLDLRNRGETEFSFVPIAPAHCEIEVDGQWYGWAESLAISPPVWMLKPGTELNDAIEIKLTDSWALPKEGNKLKHRPGIEEFWGNHLKLTPGKHTIRIRFSPQESMESYIKGEKYLSVVSNPVEIEILPEEKPAEPIE